MQSTVKAQFCTLPFDIFQIEVSRGDKDGVYSYNILLQILYQTILPVDLGGATHTLQQYLQLLYERRNHSG